MNVSDGFVAALIDKEQFCSDIAVSNVPSAKATSNSGTNDET